MDRITRTNRSTRGGNAKPPGYSNHYASAAQGLSRYGYVSVTIGQKFRIILHRVEIRKGRGETFTAPRVSSARGINEDLEGLRSLASSKRRNKRPTRLDSARPSLKSTISIESSESSGEGLDSKSHHRSITNRGHGSWDPAGPWDLPEVQ